MTKLEAINICLGSMGEPAINSLDGAGVDAQMASDLIDETSRSVQLQGWHWNREKHLLSPDSNGLINLPGNTAKVDSTDADYDLDVVQRGLRLFNKGTNDYTFTKAITVELYVILAFEDLPLSCKDFITARAAMTQQQRLLGAQELDKYLSERASTAWTQLVRDDVQVSDPNMLRDNWSNASILNRGRFGRGGY